VTEDKGKPEYREFQALSANNITSYVINPQQTGKEIKQKGNVEKPSCNNYCRGKSNKYYVF
jgi:hypothetical protein